MPRALTKAQRQLVSSLVYWFGDRFGGGIGERRSPTEIAAKLAPLDQRTPRTKTIIERTMGEFVAGGWAVASPGPRGGKGWALSEAGLALIARDEEEFRVRQDEIKRREAAQEARKATYHAELDGPDGREPVTVKAMTMEEAAQLAGSMARCRMTGTRVVAIVEEGTDAMLVQTPSRPT